MAKAFYGSISLKDQSTLLLNDSTNAGQVSLKAPSSVTSYTLTLPAAVSSANQILTFDASATGTFALLVNANVSATAAIAYSKLALTGSIVNADISASAAIAYSKLNLTGTIVNSDIASAAAIARNKLAALTANRAVVTDASGFDTISATTDTEIGFVSGVTSSIQTQLNGKASTALSNLTVSGLAAQSLLVGSSTTAVSSLSVGSNGNILTVVGGAVAWAAPTAASFKANWITSDGTTKTITHSLGDLDVIVQIYDKTDGSSIEVDSVVRTSTSVLTLTASSAPGVAGWRVLILAV